MTKDTLRKDFLPLGKPDVTEAEIAAVVDVVRSGWWTTGPKVTEFERAIAEYLGDPGLSCVGLNSATAGLHLALLALGLGPGDEVIVPTWTFAATAQVVDWVGAKLVLCDVEPDTLQIDLAQAEKLVTPRTKAIIPVHLFGYTCDMDGLGAFAAKHGLKVIEDAAHAIGTRYRGRKIGVFSDVTVFSFYATKTLAMGEGGLAVAKDPAVGERIRKQSYFGINKEACKRYEKGGSWMYDIEDIGYKYNLDSVHAAIGLVQLRRLDAMIEKRRALAAYYRNNLPAGVLPTADSPEHLHAYHLFPVRVVRPGVTRDRLSEELQKRNIGTSVHFIPLHRHSRYRARCAASAFPVADKAFGELLSLPMFSAMNMEDAAYVVDHIKDIVGG